MIDRKITIKDIAREAGVSPALVSFSLNNATSFNGERKYKVNEQTAKRIMEVAARYNYKPNNAARTLRSKHNQAIGVVLSDISNKFFSEIARQIEERAYSYNYTVMFGSTDEKVEKLAKVVDSFISKGIDGLVLVPCEGCEAIVKEIVERGIPLVLLDRVVDVEGVSSVSLNNKDAARIAVEKLFAGGFKRIEMVSYDMTLSNITEREKGYVQTMQEVGLGEYVKVHKVDYSNIDSSANKLFASLDFGEVDALFFATNSLALLGMRALNQLGLTTPKDVGVVVFDGCDAFELYPSTITYIKQPIEQFATVAIDMVINLVEKGGQENRSMVIDAELVEGDSSTKR
ncbi:MAG: LacI family DNA-binding transcriptional regulator [Tidjanibacter sp.]|nr:LacI family DNA-binding transcriptional regulator [Tidjanibacter sp.]